MKLKTKIYLLQLFFSTILLVFLFFTYKSYENQYKKDIQVYIDENVNLYKKQFLSSYNEAFKQLDTKKELFISIHNKSRQIIQENKSIDLTTLVKQLKQSHNLNNINIDIFLIDKKYTIYKTTYPKDLGFNLDVIKEAKEFLDKTTKDKKIYIADFVSTDPLSMEYKLYSYSSLDNNSYLELGFVDKNTYNNFRSIVDTTDISKNNIQLYNIVKMKDNYTYYPFSVSKIKSKKDFFKLVKKIPLDKTNDTIVNTFINKDTKYNYDSNSVTITTPLFERNVYKQIGYDNIILKVRLDLSSKRETLQHYKNIFYSSILITFIFLLFIYIFIKNSFTKPIDTILENISKKTQIDISNSFNKNDEFYIISKEYNKLFDSLNKELIINKTLLDENKRFIADTVHQIRTPLTNIMMNSELIQRNQTDYITANYTDQINASINMLTNSYEDLSYIISYNTIEYNPTILSVSTVLKDRVKFFTTISKVNFKPIVSDIKDNIDFNINQIELERLIDNNISNAIKYANTNKPITINLFTKENQIILEFKSYSTPIKDTKKLFEKNYRENESKRGLGLGLNIVKNICEKYNISYDVTYNDNQNTFSYKF